MARRVESPSSINSYNQCPRKYFYSYISKAPTKGNINTIKGKVIHMVLESFFDQPLKEGIDYDTADQIFKESVFSFFARFWKEKDYERCKLGISEIDAAFAVNDCVDMLYLWVKVFLRRMKSTELPFKEAFEMLRPKLKEQYLRSDQHAVHGYADVIEEINGKKRVMDYKTSSSAYLSDEYILQLGIYALLFQENFNEPLQEVGIYFLKDPEMEKVLPVTSNLLDRARKSIIEHHSKVQQDDFKQYPKRITGLCKWPSGQCDFYDLCFGKDGMEKPEDPLKNHYLIPLLRIQPK